MIDLIIIKVNLITNIKFVIIIIYSYNGAGTLVRLKHDQRQVTPFVNRT